MAIVIFELHLLTLKKMDSLLWQPNDSGPIYKETFAGHWPIIEPFNTASNLVFLAIVIYWSFKVFKNVRQQQFLAFATPVLFIGFVGGTLYHGTRSHEVWLLMDWLPIAILTMAVSIHFQVKNKYPIWLVLLISTFPFLVGFLVYAQLNIPDKWASAIGYSNMGLVILGPIIHHLYKQNWRDAKWVWIALLLFAFAITFRTVENTSIDVLPMGTHFLWHTFG
ncbi:MAG: hypothetical protein KDC92_15045, partial [Bacteroidetes bacterium]|nr:hypothetical protein [Bacteroidota bacterium]